MRLPPPARWHLLRARSPASSTGQKKSPQPSRLPASAVETGFDHTARRPRIPPAESPPKHPFASGSPPRRLLIPLYCMCAYKHSMIRRRLETFGKWSQEFVGVLVGDEPLIGIELGIILASHGWRVNAPRRQGMVKITGSPNRLMDFPRHQATRYDFLAQLEEIRRLFSESRRGSITLRPSYPVGGRRELS